MKILNIIIGILLFTVVAAGILYVSFRGRGSKLFIQESADLMVTNDTNDTISAEYKINGKDTEALVKPGEKVTGGRGLMRFFTAKKEGSYEVTYEYPRPKSAPKIIELSKL